MLPTTLTKGRISIAICLSLVLGTLILYWPITSYPFVIYDDHTYIVDNPHITSGLTWHGLIWAFHATYASYWHPLTWISLMLDGQLFGLNAGGYHLTNLLFHITNTLLLFIWLKNATGALWRSAFVAALFAWHPLHVESVAWASERKDVLSMFFWMLTLIVYSGYARDKKLSVYLLALGLFACALMAKPMVVTLPFVLLLLDFWPFKRFTVDDFGTALPRLLVEKIPFFALALAGSVVAFLVQKRENIVWTPGLAAQVENVLISYARYIFKLLWPCDLAVNYPLPTHWPFLWVVGAGLFVSALTVLAIVRARQNAYLMAGWFWFLGTLIPVIGIVQVGGQSIADRYAYIPSIGFFVVVAWGAMDLLSPWPDKGKFLPVAGVSALAALFAVSTIQISYWRNSIALFSHAIQVTSDNYVAYYCLGGALAEIGQKDDALAAFTESVRIEPNLASSRYHLGTVLLDRGRFDEACNHLAAAARLAPDDPAIRYDYGMALMRAGKWDDAVQQFAATVRMKPDFAEAHLNLAVILAQQRRLAEAIPHFTEAARLRPADPEILFELGLSLLDNHQPADAAVQFAKVLLINPNETKAHYRLAQALLQQNKLSEAVSHYRDALRLSPDAASIRDELNQILAAHPELR